MQECRDIFGKIEIYKNTHFKLPTWIFKSQTPKLTFLEPK